MSSVEKTREQILAERQEKKKKKAALKNQSKDKEKNSGKDSGEPGDKSKTTVQDKSSKNLPVSKGKVEDSKSKSETVVENKSNESIQICQQQQQQNITVKNSDVHFKKNNDKSNESHNNKENVKNNSAAIGNALDNENCSKESVVKVPSNQSDVGKTKSQLKAERRAKQEAERAKKLQQKSASNVSAPAQEKKAPTPPKPIQSIKIEKAGSATAPEVSRKVKLFAHLYDVSSSSDVTDSPQCVHPSIIQLRSQYSSRVVSGSNASCLALLNALRKVVMDFETPPNQEFSRGLESEISKCMSYLSNQRPVEVSMMNAVKHLKFKVNQCKGNDLECKNSISDWIDTYIKEQLEMAAKAICLFVREKITSGDVILTYGWCSLIYEILISAFNEGIKFRVIVADGRPWLEGRELLKKLVSAGIQCTYVFVNGLSFVMPEVTKILLGAHALLANGYVMSRVGSSQIALLAKTYNVPVLVCCETHKFSERVQTDSFVYNELGNPDDLATSKGCLSKELSKWKTIQCLTPLNLMYDVTPPDLVSAVVTEIAVLPCTSVPVILRIKPPDLSY